jgi:lipid-binding SYLF domain-containing protein
MTPALPVLSILVAAALPSTATAADPKLDSRLRNAAAVYKELLGAEDREIPEALLGKCRCVAVIPRVIKGAIGWGARHGSGAISCRESGGAWSPPVFLKLTGGSFGFQIGAEASDVVLFFMTDRGARSLLESKFTLGGTVGIAAGPLGRTAEASTDLKLDAEIYSYAKSKGLFAGVSLEGARLAPDTGAIKRYYGKTVSPEALLFKGSNVEVPASGQEFLRALP